MFKVSHLIKKRLHYYYSITDISFLLGSHTGRNFANLFYGLLKEYDYLKKIYTITADNASTNSKMACKLQAQFPSFNTEKQLLGVLRMSSTSVPKLDWPS